MTDLTAYFARIGYDGPREPTLKVLRALMELHPASIPFEALDVLLDRGVDLTPEAVDAKLLGARRGGYCYEQNSLFKRVLTQLGFQVEGLIARVRWQQPPDAPLRQRTHMVLRVTLEDEAWLCDVGFGTCVPTAPLRFAEREPQPTAHETYRLSRVGDEILMEAQLGQDWAPVYQVSPEVQLDQDYELPNWFTSTHPSSHFRHRLIASRTTPEARYVLSGNRLTVRTADGSMERRDLNLDELEAELATTFRLPVAPDWRPVLARAVASAAT